ncbi:MAG: hypothetical protein OEM81_05205, partial [Acidimicrobiia bacterium]|nr:hypothetical protein [Acidimicrobiia bacterium]
QDAPGPATNPTTPPGTRSDNNKRSAPPFNGLRGYVDGCRIDGKNAARPAERTREAESGRDIVGYAPAPGPEDSSRGG